MSVRESVPESRETVDGREIVAYWYTKHEDTGTRSWLDDRVKRERTESIAWRNPSRTTISKAGKSYAVRYLTYADDGESVDGYMADVSHPICDTVELFLDDPREIERYEQEDYEISNVRPLTVVSRRQE